MSLRLVVARQQGLDETMASKVDRYAQSDLADHHKAALRLCDALITQPAQIDDALRDELARHFSREQIVEITLDVMKWSTQKFMVALGTDDEVRAGELSNLVFDDKGDWDRTKV